MSKKEYTPHSSLSCCDTCCNCIGATGLQFLNLIDFAVGLTLIVFGLWMTMALSSDQVGNVNVQWISMASYILGATAAFVAVMSFVAVTSADCRKLIMPAGYISLVVVIMALCIAVTQLAWRSNFNDYLDDEQNDNNLSSDDVNTLQFLYILTTFMNFYLVVSSLIRFGGSRAFYNSSVKIDKDFTNTLLAHERSMDEKYDANRSKVYAKYDGLREHYHSKYVTAPQDEH